MWQEKQTAHHMRHLRCEKENNSEERDLEEGEKVMFDDLVDWLQEYGKLNAIDECKYAANVIKGLYFGRENLRQRLEISPYGEDKIDRLEAEIKNLSQALERVKQERDAAVKCLCASCKKISLRGNMITCCEMCHWHSKMED